MLRISWQVFFLSLAITFCFMAQSLAANETFVCWHTDKSGQTKHSKIIRIWTWMHGQEPQHTAEYLINFFHLGCIIALFTFQWGHVLSRTLSCSCLTTWWTKRFLTFSLSLKDQAVVGWFVILTSLSVDENLWCYHSHETFLAELLHGNNFVSWDLKRMKFFSQVSKTIEGVIQFTSFILRRVANGTKKTGTGKRFMQSTLISWSVLTSQCFEL